VYFRGRQEACDALTHAENTIDSESESESKSESESESESSKTCFYV
jgi:hypothetical protein